MTRKLPFNNYSLGFRRKKKPVSAEGSIFNVNLGQMFFLWRQSYKPYKNMQVYVKSSVGIYYFPDNLFWKNKQNPVKPKHPLRGSSNRLVFVKCV